MYPNSAMFETVEDSTAEETSRDRTEEWETQEEETIPGSVSTTQSSMYSDSDTYDTVMDAYERDIQINKLRAERYRASASMHRARAERNRAVFEEENVRIEAAVLLFSTVLVFLLNVVEKLFSRKNTDSF